MAPGVFVSNLPYGISEEEFSEKLKKYFPGGKIFYNLN